MGAIGTEYLNGVMVKTDMSILHVILIFLLVVLCPVIPAACIIVFDMGGIISTAYLMVYATFFLPFSVWMLKTLTRNKQFSVFMKMCWVLYLAYSLIVNSLGIYVTFGVFYKKYLSADNSLVLVNMLPIALILSTIILLSIIHLGKGRLYCSNL